MIQQATGSFFIMNANLPVSANENIYLVMVKRILALMRQTDLCHCSDYVNEIVSPQDSDEFDEPHVKLSALVDYGTLRLW